MADKIELTIRPATIKDIKAISFLSEYALKEWGIKQTAAEKKKTDDFYKSQIEHNLILIGEINNKVIGYSAFIDNRFSNKLEKRRLHITNTVIHPDFRRKGAAEKIRAKIIEIYSQKNFKRITTNHHPENKAIIYLSKKLGFKEYKEPITDASCKNDIFMELYL